MALHVESQDDRRTIEGISISFRSLAEATHLALDPSASLLTRSGGGLPAGSGETGCVIAGVLFGISEEVPHQVVSADLVRSAAEVLRPELELDRGVRPLVSATIDDVNPNPPKDTDGRREDSGRGWVRELQGRWPGVLG